MVYNIKKNKKRGKDKSVNEESEIQYLMRIHLPEERIRKNVQVKKKKEDKSGTPEKEKSDRKS